MQHILKKLNMLLPKASKYTWWDEYEDKYEDEHQDEDNEEDEC